MFTPAFFSTTLGRAALACIAAMIALNVLAMTQQLQAQQIQAMPSLYASSAAITGELA